MIAFIIAETAAGGGISPESVGAIIAAVITGLLGGGLIGKKLTSVKVSNNPLEVKEVEEFVTRREFLRLENTMLGHIGEIKGAMTGSAAKMESLFRETMSAVTAQSTTTNNKMERQHRTQMEEISKVAAAAHAGREKIWIQVNEQRATLGGLQVAGDVAHGLTKLAEALVPQQTKVEPTHSNAQ